MDVATRIHGFVAPLVAEEGIELVEVLFTGGQLQVVVDRDGGVDIDTLSKLSGRVSRLLDQHDVVPGRYILELSSPGLERSLRTPEQFRRFVGATVSVKTRPHVAGERREKGRLQAADEEGIVLEPSEGPGAGVARRLAYGDIDRARTVFEWGPAPKPGKAPSRKGRAKAGHVPQQSEASG
ncbi:MAG: ribosome maturation factor RimP [Actinomycetota bacterium]|nr:ribosome maturation factor RimP [Actinomycetota bacterium]MDQ3680693.1 ribosome maturation factor RimP [Actinomycetota bacterium]